MPNYPFMQVDAFTTQPLGGNPCAVIFETDDLSAEQMQALAREMNLSETAFVQQSTIADFKVRYFTPAEEIPLAGHPTIATSFALVESGRLALQGNHTPLTLELQVGPIQVDILASAGRVTNIIMTQKKPKFLETIPTTEILPVFGLQASQLLPNMPCQIVSTGTPQLMIPTAGLSALRDIQVDMPALAKLRQTYQFFSSHLFCLEGVAQGQTFARHFSSPPDVFEDPFTGSATGGMAAYLWHYALLNAPSFIAEQGHWLQRPGQAQVEIIGPKDDIETVKVGGPAVTILSGTLHL